MDSNKQIGSDNDNIDKNTSMANLNQPNNIEFSFKGASSEIQGLDRGGDSILPITRTNSESNRAHSFAVVKPSPFLLEKRNSEKNFYMKKTFGNQDDLLEKTATFLDSSLTTSKVLQDSETFNFPKKSETPNPDQDKIKNLMVIPQEEMTSIVESEVSRNFTKQNTLESIKAPSKLGSENSNRTEAQSNRTDSGNDKTNPATKQSSEIENQSSGSKSLGKPGIFLPLNTMQKNLLEKKKSNDAVLVLPPSDSLPRDGNNNNVDRNPIKTELKFRVNLLELVRKPDNEYSKKESNSTAEDEINEHNPSKRLLPPLENKPVVNHNGFPRKNLISFARAETTPSNNNHTINVPTTPVHNGTPTTIVIDTLSPPTKPTSSALHINLIDVQNKQPYFDGMTPITPVDTSFNKSIFDRSILLDVNNISRYDPDQISVNYDINHVQYDETEQQPRNLLQNERSPNKKFSKSKTAFREPEIKSYTSLAPENNEPTSMNSLSPMAAHSRVPNIGSINFLHSPKSAAITPSSRFARQQLFTRTKSTVVETEQLTKTKDKQGQKKINQYTMIKEIGRGGFGKVKLAIKEPDNNQFVLF